MANQEPEDASDITAAELRDIVAAADGVSDAEALCLVDALEESGIPAVAEPQRVEGAFQGNRIYVPRRFHAHARAVIAQARAQAQARGVEQAFDIENIAETTDNTRDEVLMAMFALRAETAEARSEKLSQYAAVWLRDGVSAVYMAKCLAAAGLRRDEAEAFVAAQTERQRASCDKPCGQRRALGAILILYGVVGIALSAHQWIWTGALGSLGTKIAAIVVGLIMMRPGRR
jgi:hypothetical protein